MALPKLRIQPHKSDNLISDHLGSAAYLTDDHGYVTQSLNYMPYGEDWVEDNRFNPIDTVRLGIYRFNGKEKDYESGFHYYGARYHWSEVLTGWLSVHPLSDKYPGISPYAYCAWNPIVYIDSNGMEFTDWPKIGRCVKGALNIAGGAITAVGGIVIGAGGSVITGGAAAPIGAFVVGTGAYEIAEGIHTITNALSGAPQSSDPQYTTPLGAATNNTTVDVVTSVVVGYGSTAVTTFGKATTVTSTTVSTSQQGVKTSAEGASSSRANTVLSTIVTTADVATSTSSSSAKSTPKSSSQSTGKTTQSSSPRGTNFSQSSNNSSKPFYEW